MPKLDDHKVEDPEGWFLGLDAVFRSLFGTDTEILIRRGEVDDAINQAQSEISGMSRAATKLLDTTEGTLYRHKDAVDEAFEAIVKDLT